MASSETTASNRILKNSFWFGLETALEMVVYLSTSVAVARYLGPQKLGYFSYISYFVAIVTRTGGVGLAGATNKYMSEYLALDRPGTARAVYNLAYRYQLLGSILITALGLATVLLFGDRSYRLMSSILIVSIVPGVMSWVPAQANNAFEDARKNTLSALGYIFSYAAMILLTLYFRWDLVGIALALLVGRTVEVFLRTIPLHARLRTLPVESLDHEMALSIRRYCLEAIGVQMVVSIVWDRSEMVFLRWFSQLDQLAFYSLSFGLASNLLTIPRVLGVATGITLMVESSRDPASVKALVKTASRYLLLIALPVFLGAAAIAGKVIGLVYGTRYAGAVPVLIVASLLAVPRSLQQIPEILMRAADRQRQLFTLLTIIGVINIALDYAFIPRYGAVGAAWGNGLAQTLGVVVVWQAARRHYRFTLPKSDALRLLLASSIMGLCAWELTRLIRGFPGVIIAVVTAAPLYLLLVKLVKGLEATDRQRLAPVGARLPEPARRLYSSVITFITPDPV